MDKNYILTDEEGYDIAVIKNPTRTGIEFVMLDHFVVDKVDVQSYTVDDEDLEAIVLVTNDDGTDFIEYVHGTTIAVY